jgi:hypothetical protein
MNREGVGTNRNLDEPRECPEQDVHEFPHLADFVLGGLINRPLKLPGFALLGSRGMCLWFDSPLRHVLTCGLWERWTAWGSPPGADFL